MEQTLFWFILSFVLIEFIVSKWLGWLNYRQWDKPIPEELNGLYEPEKYEKAKEYARANYRLSGWRSGLNLFLMILIFSLEGFAWLDHALRTFISNPVLLSLAFFGVLAGVSSLVQLPFKWYSTFVIEEKFGFNKSTPALFIQDRIKSLILGALLGGTMLTLISYFYYLNPQSFWWICLILVTSVSIFFAMFYTSLLLPLFNKLSPLPEGELKKAIEEYAQRTNFPLNNLYVMDGSKRSAKANAFFSGMFGKKSIVLFDTLIKDHSTEEITAIVAHETGHYKHRHVMKSLFISILQMAVMLYLFGKLSAWSGLATVLGADQASFHLSLLVFTFLYSPVSTLIGIAMNVLSRKNEYEADAYAKSSYNAEPLIRSLNKLSVTNLSSMNPHPWYVFVYYSHPPLFERLRALKAS